MPMQYMWSPKLHMEQTEELEELTSVWQQWKFNKVISDVCTLIWIWSNTVVLSKIDQREGYIYWLKITLWILHKMWKMTVISLKVYDEFICFKTNLSYISIFNSIFSQSACGANFVLVAVWPMYWIFEWIILGAKFCR